MRKKKIIKLTIICGLLLLQTPSFGMMSGNVGYGFAETLQYVVIPVTVLTVRNSSTHMTDTQYHPTNNLYQQTQLSDYVFNIHTSDKSLAFNLLTISNKVSETQKQIVNIGLTDFGYYANYEYLSEVASWQHSQINFNLRSKTIFLWGPEGFGRISLILNGMPTPWLNIFTGYKFPLAYIPTPGEENGDKTNFLKEQQTYAGGELLFDLEQIPMSLITDISGENLRVGLTIHNFALMYCLKNSGISVGTYFDGF
jgi:hypothetical protein